MKAGSGCFRLCIAQTGYPVAAFVQLRSPIYKDKVNICTIYGKRMNNRFMA